MISSPTLFTVSELRARDRADWEHLALEYQIFDDDFASDAEMARAWTRLTVTREIRGLGALVDDRLVGIAHFHMHEHVWHGTVCYLEDLFVDEQMRKLGIGRALIEHVALAARTQGCFRLYWVTKHNNVAARRLYDRIAIDTGYVRYDVPLDG
jgi:GNAT superfamily N-acetyltransferase